MRRCPGLPNGAPRSAGFSLIELLVALLVLSVGLIGLAGLQSRGLRDNHSALLRTQAVNRAEDMLDRMRANREAALAGDYNIGQAVDPSEPDYSGLVFNDLEEWKNSLANDLPAGKGSVSVTGGIATVIVQWEEAVGPQTVTSTTRLW